MIIPPAKLYWYRSLSDDRRPWAREVMLDSTLYMSAPIEYNDLFEFQFLFDLDASVAQRIDVFTKHLMEIMRMSKGEAEKEARKMACVPSGSGLSDQEFTALMESKLTASLRREYLQETGVISLTDLDRHPLMWAHYADQHKGLCLEFDTTKGIGSNPITAALDLTYQQPVPVVRWFVVDEEERVRGIFLTKSLEWKYEHEWRVVLPSRARSRIPYPPEALTAVILGARIAPDVEAEVRDWMARLKHRVELRRVRPHKHQYALEIDVVKEGIEP